MENMTFDQALVAIKEGKRLARSGWNGEGMFVFLVPGSNFAVNREPLLSILGEGAEVTYRPHIDICHPDGAISVWQPSMGDVMADDWYEVLPGVAHVPLAASGSVQRYRYSRSDVEACRYENDPRKSPADLDAASALAAWCGGSLQEDAVDGFCIFVPTPDGIEKAQLGDWIYKECDGSFWVMGGFFALTYDRIETEGEA